MVIECGGCFIGCAILSFIQCASFPLSGGAAMEICDQSRRRRLVLTALFRSKTTSNVRSTQSFVLKLSVYIASEEFASVEMLRL